MPITFTAQSLYRILSQKEIETAYEVETGNVIVETFKGIDPLAVPGVIINGHGPFTWVLMLMMLFIML